MNFKSYSSRQTEEFGEAVAKEILNGPLPAHARVIALVGDLGSGKTTFTQGFMKGLGVSRRASSPTFVIMKRTGLRKKNAKNVFHIDAYRMKDAAELSRLGIKDIMRNPHNIVLIEWADKVSRLLPKAKIKIRFAYGRDPETRRITRT